MFFASLGSTSRLCSVIPPLARTLVNRAASRPIPPPRGIDLLPPAVALGLTSTVFQTEKIATPSDFLKAIGRSSETKVTVEKWEDFWKTSGQKLRKSGLAVRDRRCDGFPSYSYACLLDILVFYADIFYGVWRNIAAVCQSNNLLMNQSRRRQSEGE